MNCIDCKYMSKSAGSQFSAGIHVYCLKLKCVVERDHGCPSGEKRRNKK
jgi:hypothetical protein